LTGLAVASFLAFGALLVLYGANASEMIEALGLGYADLGLLGSCLSLGLGVGIVIAGPPRRPPAATTALRRGLRLRRRILPAARGPGRPSGASSSRRS
jgi:hypothetical protein